MLFGKQERDEMQLSVERAVEKIVQRALHDADSTLARLGDLTKLREELETLKIEKGRKDEEYGRKDREIEHKVGLERKRQETEIALAKREAVLSAKEEALQADRKRFEEQLSFHEKRFTEEVGYLKGMITALSEKLPTATITEERGKARAK
jgi:hypothetical protein